MTMTLINVSMLELSIYVFQWLLFDRVNIKMQFEWTTAYQYRLNDCHTSGAGGLRAEAPPVLPPAHHQSIPLVPQPIWRQIHINTNICIYQYKFKYIAPRWLRPISFPKPYHCRFILYFSHLLFSFSHKTIDIGTALLQTYRTRLPYILNNWRS